MDSCVRTEFGPRPGRLRGALIVIALGMLLLAGAASVAWLTSGPRSVPPTLLLGLVGLVLTGVGLSGLWTGIRRYALTINAEGVHVHSGGHHIDLRWTDMDSWWVGVPEEYLARKVQREMVLATPATHVTQPDAGSRRLLWSPQRRRWVICEPVQTNGTADEIIATMSAFAPNKRSLRESG
jgi:hypothetical protein